MAGITTDSSAISWFGSFSGFCQSVPLPLCPLVGLPAGQGSIPATCYSRNTEVFGQIVLMPALIVGYLLAFIMCLIMMYHVRSKYTAVGRKEMVIFFYLYLTTHFVELTLTTGIVRASSVLYPHVVAAHIGLISATFWCLLVNGFIGYQMIEDGTWKSVWLLRLSSTVVATVGYFIAIDTFLGFLKFFNRANPIGLWVLYFVLNGAFLFAYIVLQVVLVVNMFDSRWPVGDILIGTAFFGISYLVLFVFGPQICLFSSHYVDGYLFGTLFNLLAVLMVYKYWDSITKEDLEFAVHGVSGNWEVRKNSLLSNEMGGIDDNIYCEDAMPVPLSSQMDVPKYGADRSLVPLPVIESPPVGSPGLGNLGTPYMGPSRYRSPSPHNGNSPLLGAASYGQMPPYSSSPFSSSSSPVESYLVYQPPPT